jgi:hypothetical protein
MNSMESNCELHKRETQKKEKERDLEWFGLIPHASVINKSNIMIVKAKWRYNKEKANDL